MNTFLSREQFFAFVSNFRTLAQSKELSPTDMLFYNIARGLPADRGFAPITNVRKLEAGQDPRYAFRQAKNTLAWRLRKTQTWIQGRYGVDFTPEIQLQMYESLQ